jgi:hypothetical protein
MANNGVKMVKVGGKVDIPARSADINGRAEIELIACYCVGCGHYVLTASRGSYVRPRKCSHCKTINTFDLRK